MNLHRAFPEAIAVLALVGSAALPCQNEAQTTGTGERPPLVRVRASAMPALLAAWGETAVGRLAADPEAAAAADSILGTLRRRRARERAVLATAIELGIELDPFPLAQLLTSPDPLRFLDHPLAEFESAELAGFSRDGTRTPHFVTTLACRPRFEGRWTAAFEAEKAQLAEAPWFDVNLDAKVGGNPAIALTLKGTSAADAETMSIPTGLWMQHLPGRFLYSTGRVDEMPAPPAAASDTDAVPGFAITLELAQFVEMFIRNGNGMPPDFAQLGFTHLRRLEWRVRPSGERLLDEFEVTPNEAPDGLVGMLLRPLTRPDPAPPLLRQPLPKGGLLQLRAVVDPDLVLEFVRGLPLGDFGLTAEDQEKLTSTLTGAIALAVTAPPPGGLIPRFYLALGLADEPACHALLAQALAGATTKTLEIGGVDCTAVTIDGAPKGLEPTLAFVDGVLHLAESRRSLRALLTELGRGGDALDVGDAPVPGDDGDGEIVPSFDLRFDEVAIYRAFRDVWLPLYELTAGEDTGVVQRDDLPSVDFVAEYCGKVRGVVRKRGDTFTLQQLGTLGGVELAALAMTWGPILTSGYGKYALQSTEQKIAARRLELVWPAFERFHTREGRWPTDLGELFVAEKLADDALLLPADDLAETVTGANGKAVQTSFRYFATPAVVELGGPREMLLIAIRSGGWNRAMLDSEGTVIDQVDSTIAARPIDRFGQ
ncbi:MAG: hypothetical protein KDE27_32830 [Planctomycetes bacterium]|nr:hypothetical protein [Planctomycetota bacterium]